MSELYDVIGKQEYANLLADPNGAEIISVPLEPGANTVKKGTVIYRGDKGLWAAASTTEMDGTKQLAVLNETVDTGAEKTGTAPEAAAFRSGRFIDGAVKDKSDAVIAEAEKIELRRQGIVFLEKESTAEFENKGAGE